MSLNTYVYWVLYKHPKSHPNEYVIREWHGDKEAQLWTFPSEADAREFVRTQRPRAQLVLSFQSRDPHIVTIWLT